MNEARKLLDECKNDLSEIKALIEIIRSLPPENLLKTLRRMNDREKMVMLKIMVSNRKTKSPSETPAYIT